MDTTGQMQLGTQKGDWIRSVSHQPAANALEAFSFTHRGQWHSYLSSPGRVVWPQRLQMYLPST